MHQYEGEFRSDDVGIQFQSQITVTFPHPNDTHRTHRI